MDGEMRRLSTGLAALGALLVLAWSMVGCGGSGSSGFDVSPESAAIATAIDQNECVEVDQQVFCPSGVTPPTGEFHGASVTIATPPAPLVCGDPLAVSDDCKASLEFTTEGFTRPNSLLAAVAETERGPWTLVPLKVTEDDVTAPRTVTIELPGRSDTTVPTPLIAAVLVYEGVPPETVPKNAAHLADLGPDLVYVSQRLQIVVPR